MSIKSNIGEAGLILGGVYFILNFRMRWWGILGIMLLIGLAVCTWDFTHRSKELKDLVLAQIEEIKTRTLMMKGQARLFAAQTLYYMKRRN